MRKFDSACFVTGAHMDLTGTLFAPAVAARSNPGRLSRRPGGIGLNTASVAAALGLRASIAGAVGLDADGDELKRVATARGIADALTAVGGRQTGTFLSIIEPDGQMVIGLADLAIHEEFDATWFLGRCGDALQAADLWFLTANQTEATLRGLGEAAGDRLLAAATVSAAKAGRLRPLLARIDLLFANLGEARALSGLGDADAGKIARHFAETGIASGVISDGDRKVTYWSDGIAGSLAPPPVATIADVNGAGDALAGTVLAGLSRGWTMERCVALGVAAAGLTLASTEPVASGLSWETLETIAETGNRR